MAAAGLLVRISGDSFSNLGSGRPCRRPREPAFRGGTWEPGFPTRAAGGGRDSGSRELGLASGGDGETWTSGFLSQCVHFTGAHPVGGEWVYTRASPCLRVWALPGLWGATKTIGAFEQKHFRGALLTCPPGKGVRLQALELQVVLCNSPGSRGRTSHGLQLGFQLLWSVQCVAATPGTPFGKG